jgi:hypothetical protein
MPVSVLACRACEGRGWKVVSSRRVVMVADVLVRVVRQPCLDCGGQATRQVA